VDRRPAYHQSLEIKMYLRKSITLLQPLLA
jgi:hypothetical protein